MNPFLRGLISDALKIVVVELPVFIKTFREAREATRQQKARPTNDARDARDAMVRRLEAIEGAIEALTKATDDLARAVEAQEKRINFVLALAAVGVALAILLAVFALWR